MGRHTLVALAVGCLSCSPAKDSQPADSAAPPTDSTAPTDTELGASDWTLLAADRPGALLSLWSRTPDELWVVGADAGDGPEVLHLDEGSWSEVEVDSPGDLWWVWGDGAGTIYMVGTEGRVLALDEGSGEVRVEQLGPELTLFGIWGAAPDDIWAVGGDPYAGDGAVLWHYDGSAWSRAEGLPAAFDELTYGFKVWGSASDDVWVVGSEMFSMHYDGSSWTAHIPEGADATRSLFTVDGDGQGELYAVGGVGSSVAALLSWDGSAWIDQTPDFAGQINGVAVRPDQQAIACGKGGALYQRSGEAWIDHPAGQPTGLDLHACLLDDEGGAWTVGGKMSNYPLSDGLLAYHGPGDPPPLP